MFRGEMARGKKRQSKENEDKTDIIESKICCKLGTGISLDIVKR